MSPTRRGARTRRLIIDRCAVVFDQLGFHGATLTELVGATGLTRGAFYFHFDSKDALAEAIVREQAERWPQLLAAVARLEPDPMRRLIRFAFASAAMYQTDIVVRAASRLINERLLIRRDLPETYPWWISSVHAMLVDADALGQLRHTADLVEVPPPPRPAGLPDNDPAGLVALAEHLVSSWVGSQQTAATSGQLDLAGRVYAGWRVAISAVCRAPEPRDELVGLSAQLADQLRDDPTAMLNRILARAADAV